MNKNDISLRELDVQLQKINHQLDCFDEFISQIFEQESLFSLEETLKDPGL